VSGPFIAVLDYGIGNLRSAEKALQHLGANARLVASVDEAASADGVVLPGVGAFGACVDALVASGLDRAAWQAVDSGRPFFGVCVGFQLMYEGSAESPGSRGLGIFPGQIERLPDGVKHPQMQWNRLAPVAGRTSELLSGLGEDPWVYFVHSFAPGLGPETVAVCDYGGPVSAVVERENVWGTQFHPEKSGKNGLSILANFVARCA
jgi:imidazole glycerol-phosphate synthase subunit HisH